MDYPPFPDAMAPANAPANPNTPENTGIHHLDSSDFATARECNSIAVVTNIASSSDRRGVLEILS